MERKEKIESILEEDSIEDLINDRRWIWRKKQVAYQEI